MVLEPEKEAKVREAVLAARDESIPLTVEGGGTRRGLGRPVQTQRTLSLRRLSGITLYEPSEMVIGAWAGTPLATVEATLAEKGQMLAFEPMDHRAVFGSEGTPTIGAVAAANISGPRRLYAGACRDSLIGIRFVNGLGEIIKNGGRVMKNVTGLDLVKLHCGAYGTLGVLTEVIFKVIPRPPQAATLAFSGLDDATAVAVMTAAMGTPYEVTGAAHMPAGTGAPVSRTLLRIEGLAEQIAYRSKALSMRFAAHGSASLVEGAPHDDLWAGIRDARALAEPRDRALWRLSVPPSRGADVAATVRQPGDRWFYDWSGGLVWMATQRAPAEVHRAVTALGGHAMLVRAHDAVRASEPVFPPLPEAVMRLQLGVKAAHDPAALLNPGRMVAGL